MINYLTVRILSARAWTRILAFII